MEKQKNIPALRFPEFKGEWDNQKIEKVFNIFNGYAFPSNAATDEGILWVKIADVGIQEMKKDNLSYLPQIFGVQHKKFLLKKGDYVVALTRPILNGKLKIAQIDDYFNNSLLNQRVGKIISLNNLSFVYALLQRDELIKSIENNIAGSDPPNLSPNEINTIELFIPTLPEQTKIAEFLTAVEDRLNQLKKKKTLLEQYKKGVMQKIFNQEIRFKNDDGNEFPEWEVKPLSKLMSVSNKRNSENKFSKDDVLSVSGEFGVVNQIKLLGRSFAGISVSNYPIVESGYIVYTKSPLKANPYGIIKYNKGKAGIVSTLYAVYKCGKNLNGQYLDYYFQLDDNTNRYLRPLVRKGAKNDMKISNEHVLTGEICIGSFEEQTKISNFLAAIDGKIEVCSKQITKTEQYKKGLLQQMFV